MQTRWDSDSFTASLENLVWTASPVVRLYLHRLTNLEGLYRRVEAALRPGGKFFFNEYVGPNRFQYDDERMDLINRYFRLFPDRLRVDHLTGRLLWRRERLSRDQVEREDPTEAVRSEEVLPLARRFFTTEWDCQY